METNSIQFPWSTLSAFMHKTFIINRYKEGSHGDYQSQDFINYSEGTSRHHPSSCGVAQQLAKFIRVHPTKSLVYSRVQLAEVRPDKQSWWCRAYCSIWIDVGHYTYGPQLSCVVMTGPLGLDLRDGANGQSAGPLLSEPFGSPRCQGLRGSQTLKSSLAHLNSIPNPV